MLHTGVKKWFLTDPEVITIEPGNRLYDWMKRVSNLLAGSKTLLLIDDITADETLDKRRNSLLILAVSGRREGHFAIVVNAILHCHSPKHQETKKDALHLAPEKERRLGYNS